MSGWWSQRRSQADSVSVLHLTSTLRTSTGTQSRKIWMLPFTTAGFSAQYRTAMLSPSILTLSSSPKLQLASLGVPSFCPSLPPSLESKIHPVWFVGEQGWAAPLTRRGEAHCCWRCTSHSLHWTHWLSPWLTCLPVPPSHSRLSSLTNYGGKCLCCGTEN